RDLIPPAEGFSTVAPRLHCTLLLPLILPRCDMADASDSAPALPIVRDFRDALEGFLGTLPRGSQPLAPTDVDALFRMLRDAGLRHPILAPPVGAAPVPASGTDSSFAFSPATAAGAPVGASDSLPAGDSVRVPVDAALWVTDPVAALARVPITSRDLD